MKRRLTVKRLNPFQSVVVVLKPSHLHNEGQYAPTPTIGGVARS